MRKNSMLTAVDLHNIVTDNFAPDVEKLASEIEVSLGNPAALQAIGARIIADYGQEGLREVMHHVKAIHAEEFSNSEMIDRIVGGPYYRFRSVTTKGQIAAEHLYEIYGGGAVRGRKKTTKADAVARHITALVRLLENEPDTIVGPILNNLSKRIDAARLLLLQMRKG
jgi:hypothetical protein